MTQSPALMTDRGGHVRVYLGGRLTNAAEARCLARLEQELRSRSLNAVLLANLTLGPRKRQIDLIVALETIAIAVEIKGFVHPVSGREDGAWDQHLADGTRRSLGTHNPYQQALHNRFTVSDAVAAFLSLPTPIVRDAIDGALCLYVAPPMGSAIPASSHKLLVGGFEQLLRALDRTARRPVALADWERFARSLKLFDRDQLARDPFVDEVDRYRTRFLDLSRTINGPFVEPDYADGHTTQRLVEQVRLGDQLQIVGGSGSGKTRLLAELAERLAAAGALPLIITARDFEGQLAPLLRRSVAPFSDRRLTQLLSGLTGVGADIVLLVDGTNECPPNRLAGLVTALQAARLGYGIQAVLTGQAEVALPMILRGSVVSLVQPDRAHAEKLVRAHLGRGLETLEQGAIDLVATAHDAPVLAETLADHDARDGRHALYHSFVQRRLARHRAQHAALGLEHLAASMRGEFTRTLARTTAETIIARDDPAMFSGAVASGLIVEKGGKVSFRHDLIADFFGAEGLLRQTCDHKDLARETSRPINAELREFILGGCSTLSQIGALLSAKPDPRLLRAGLSRRAGDKAQAYILDRLRGVLRLLEKRFTTIVFAFDEPPQTGADLLKVVGMIDERLELSETDKIYLTIMPAALGHGLFDDILDTLAAIDAHLERERSRLRALYPNVTGHWRGVLSNAVYGAGFSWGSSGELLNLFTSIQGRWIDEDRRRIEDVSQRLETFETLSFGQFHLLLSALRSEDGPLPARFVEMIEHVWSTGIYHVRLFAADLIRFRGGELDLADQAELHKFLNERLSGDAWMNSIIIDALQGVGGLDEEFAIEDALREFRAIAGLPPSEEATSAAQRALSSTYDHPFSRIYWEAFYDHLDPRERQFLALRALDAPKHDPWLLNDALRVLERDPTPDAVPVLQCLAAQPIAKSSSQQYAVKVYVQAIALLARMGVPLDPPSFEAATPAAHAWSQAAPLFYALNQPLPPPRDQLNKLMRVLVDVGTAEAVDVLRWLRMEKRNVAIAATVEVEEHLPDAVLDLARLALAPHYRPASMFNEQFQRNELVNKHVEFALTLMETKGRSSDLPHVQRWLEDPLHGERALQAARIIEARN